MAGKIIPNIVTDGLIHYSDAANPKFYLGGTNTYSLLTGGVGILDGVSVVGGTADKSFSFDGIDDILTMNNSYKKNVNFLPVTIDAWVYVDPLCPEFNTIFTSSYDSFYRGVSLNARIQGSSLSFAFSYTDGSGGVGSNNRRTFLSDFSFSVGAWYHVTCVMINDSTGNFYCNGEEYSFTNSGFYLGTAIQISNDYPALLGKANGYPYYFKGLVSNVKVYDRALSKNESIQNFKAHKKRYNL
jgi:hypothetical protein